MEVYMKKFSRLIFLLASAFFCTTLAALPISNVPTFEFEGAFDYFILSKSLLANNISTQSYEPQGDTSIGVEGSSDWLLETDIPKDAVIEKAFLVWFSSIDTADPTKMTDNEVTLTTPDGEDHVVTASYQGNSQSNQGFEFESHYSTQFGGGSYYYYIYRVDVTDIIANFQYDHQTGEIRSLVGEYKVRGVDDIYDCNDDEKHVYCSSASMIGGWQLILVYGSSQIARKRLYLYHGLTYSSNTLNNPTMVTISNFELPEKAAVKISFVTADGDDVASAPEYLELKGGLAPENMVLGEPGNNTCNPLNQPFNSKFRTVNYKGEQSECREELSFDIDTFFLQYEEGIEESIINPHVQYGTNTMYFFIKTGADILLTNYLILSVDTRLPAFDIPERNEKFLLTPLSEENKVCDKTIFGYQIVVENHGQEPAEMVFVRDKLTSQVDYIPGTFQIDHTGTGKCFESVPDNAGFPLESGMMVKEKMEICQNDVNCERILLRFLVKPKEDLPKNASFLNTAAIWDAKTGEESAYKSNQGLPVRATFSTACTPLDDAEVRAIFYTKESMSCEGTVDVPEDDTTDSGDTGELPGDTGDSSDTDGSADTGSDTGSKEGSETSADEEDDSACTILLID